MTARQLTRDELRHVAAGRPPATGHATTVTVIDPARAAGAIDRSRLAREIEPCLAGLPALRRVVVEVPLRLDRPWWADDPDFDLDHHVGRATVPAPGGDRALAEVVATLHARPLDPRRPLWEAYLIEGLASGRVAILTKVHLAALADAEGADLLAALVTETPVRRPASGPAWRPAPGPGAATMACRAWANALRDPARTLTSAPRRLRELPVARGLVNPALAVVTQRAARRPIAAAGPDAPAPRAPFNRRIGPGRRWAPASVDLDRVRAARRVHGVRVLDVVLAMVAGALRWWLLRHGRLPAAPLRALVPMAVRGAAAPGGVDAVVIGLATDRSAPADRLRAISAEVGAAALGHGALPAAELGAGAGWPSLAATGTRLLLASPLIDRVAPVFNTAVTVVPGPAGPRFALGAPVEAVHPVPAVVDGIGLHIGAVSVADRMHFGLTADRELVPDLEALAGRLTAELEELESR